MLCSQSFLPYNERDYIAGRNMGDYFKYSDTESIYYETIGHGSRGLILLHGFGASRESWNDILPLLKTENTTIILVDLKGFGNSSKSADKSSDIRKQALIVQALIEQFAFEAVSIMGHSYGGGVALFLTLNTETSRSIKITSLILVDSAAFTDKIPYYIKILKCRFLGLLIMTLISARIIARKTLKFLFYDNKLIDDERIDRYAKYYGTREVSRSFITAARGIVPDDADSLIARYGNIKVPTLIIWGNNDRALPVEHAHRLAGMIENSEVVVIPECGHIPHEEKPVETTKAINLFLRKYHTH
jgi:pimeloyl-ACP methyl ester carboxylesterase